MKGRIDRKEEQERVARLGQMVCECYEVDGTTRLYVAEYGI